MRTDKTLFNTSKILKSTFDAKKGRYNPNYPFATIISTMELNGQDISQNLFKRKKIEKQILLLK